MTKSGVTVVLGSQWGDEGKGKLVDLLCDELTFWGGNNAGHTIVVDNITYDFHILPSGLVNPNCVNLIGSGVVVHIPSLFSELEAIQKKGLDATDRLFVSDRAHLVFDIHQLVDGLKEVELGRSSIGTTKKGIGPAYSSKASRSGIRVEHLYDWPLFESRFRDLVASRHRRYGDFDYDVEAELGRYKEFAKKLKPFVIDAVLFMHKSIQEKKRILVEGANALMLDLDYGTYPYVTSSNTSAGGVCTGLGIPPTKITRVIGVVKAYTTRVGSGPFPTEQLNDIGGHLQQVGREWGVTTGRKRRCGWLDLVVVNYSNAINGYTSLNITKLDVLDQLPSINIGIAYLHDGKELVSVPASLHVLSNCEVKYIALPGWHTQTTGCTSYSELPENAKAFIEYIEKFLDVPVEYVGVGPGRMSMLKKSCD
ncbi:Adenylosuccinate synthetase [Neolecta irregularis DAH-3]|uniref:Adenylosuccinate synthetase n=1 Tax=Neolecta irregularis (strain DAH-3) TaxID=1198029 RepID=A0A1U7LW34_NEOID|nr:Adenylosuccinate synthetase [Neolecta irregularis DAH-3]|eukprot:OLL26890.1 Adenylosuccinate synthetase [Neolecta irregularis DAH-3]